MSENSSRNKRVQHVVEAAIARVAFTILRLLPVRVASALGGGLARAVGPHLKASKIARENLRRVFPEKSDEQREQIVRQVWDNLGRNVAEYPHLKTIVAKRLEIIGGEHIAALADDGKPGIVMGSHFGGWELSGLLAERLGVPVHVVYRAPNNPLIDSMIRKARGHEETPFIAKGAKGARALITAMRKGGHLGILVDQKMNDGMSIDFLGRPAMTAPAIAHVALKFQCPIVPGYIERLPGARFRAMVFPPLDLPDSGDREQDVHDLMVQINQMIGGWVREKPGQWLWLHRRWPKEGPAK